MIFIHVRDVNQKRIAWITILYYKVTELIMAVANIPSTLAEYGFGAKRKEPR